MLLLTGIITAYLLYLLLEFRAVRSARRSFLHVIHVNGIRGKTGTCRTLDAVLRTKYRVFTKTTGTDAATIDVDGTEAPIKRLGPASIREQIRILRRAAREGAQILIVECMAVNPDLQAVAQDSIVRGDISVITNVRYDHILDMGETREEIASSLSAVIPENGILVTAEPEGERFFGDICRARGTELVLCPSAGDASDNVGIARAIAGRLDIGEDLFAEALSGIHEDFGVSRLYEVAGPEGVRYHFLNLFSVNDPMSTESNLQNALGDLGGPGKTPLFFLYNHRPDRPDRALLFSRHFFPNYTETPLFLMGPGLPLPRRLFRNAGVKDIRVIRGPGKREAAPWVFPSLPEGALLVGIGNIKGPAYTLIEQLNRGADL
ncbi:MAG: poly-gamma-glutamate synthase PgsB [Clostridium sp.]|nr:poly-gamma-glutamate synthase PgsB [Clostridium sp.]